MRARLQLLERSSRAKCSLVICSIVGKILVSWKGPNCGQVKRNGNHGWRAQNTLWQWWLWLPSGDRWAEGVKILFALNLSPPCLCQLGRPPGWLLPGWMRGALCWAALAWRSSSSSLVLARVFAYTCKFILAELGFEYGRVSFLKGKSCRILNPGVPQDVHKIGWGPLGSGRCLAKVNGNKLLNCCSFLLRFLCHFQHHLNILVLRWVTWLRCTAEMFHFLPPRTVYVMEFYFGRVVFISHIYAVLCFHQVSKGNVYQITEKLVEFGSFSVQPSLRWSRVAKTLQLHRECCRWHFCRQIKKADSWVLLMDHVICSWVINFCSKPSNQNPGW